MTASVIKFTGEDPYLIVLKRTDIGPILVDLLKLKPNGLSPFAEVLGSYSGGDLPLSPEGKDLAGDGVFAAIAGLLAAPDILIRNRLGGSMALFEEVRICGGKALGQGLIVVTIGEKGTYILQVFDHYRKFVHWWADSFAGKNPEIIANYIPPRVSLESFLFLLHAVDWFKRESYKNALDYGAGQAIYINPREFSEGMEKALKSKDMRWLLPAFVMLLPGLERYNLALQPEQAKVINTMQFFNNAKHPETREDVYVFGEAGQAMGVEFMRSWLLAAGFEISKMTAYGIKMGGQLFVAPTALANHFVQLEPGDGNSCMVNHQAYTYQQFKNKMETIILNTMKEVYLKEADVEPQPEPNVKAGAEVEVAGDGFEAASKTGAGLVTVAKAEPAAGGEAETVNEVEPGVETLGSEPARMIELSPGSAGKDTGTSEEEPRGANRCPKCDAERIPGNKFCVECGALLPAAGSMEDQKTLCPSCRQEVPTESKFCTKCGFAMKSGTGN